MTIMDRKVAQFAYPNASDYEMVGRVLANERRFLGTLKVEPRPFKGFGPFETVREARDAVEGAAQAHLGMSAHERLDATQCTHSPLFRWRFGRAGRGEPPPRW